LSIGGGFCTASNFSSALIFFKMRKSDRTARFQVESYDLEATLNSGQAFRWEQFETNWEGIVKRRWVKLSRASGAIVAETADSVLDWDWLKDYLQVELPLENVIASFPDDESLRAAVSAFPGLRLLRQDPWECLASFILSSNKRIVHIRQIIRALCRRFGEEIPSAAGSPGAYAFPSAARLAETSEGELRECKMGFRARYLREAARLVATSKIDLDSLRRLTCEEARGQLMKIPGIGCKIADCVLLFSLGFHEAFPIDVWIMKGLRELYFENRPVPMKELREFATGHFGEFAGYAQQYLFHYLRTRTPDTASFANPVQ